jgi:CHAD domain-containing protein
VARGPLATTLAATLAAGAVTVAVGAGLALRKRARERAARRFALAPGEGLAQGLRRIALGQLALALELLRGDSGEDPARAVHETRKALKRLRALMRLLREEMGEKGFARENALLRDAGQRLAGARDAEVMVSTLDGLLRQRRKLARRAGVRRLRTQFERERERAAARSFEGATVRAQVAGDLRELQLRVALWRLPEREGSELVRAGLERIYRQGRRRERAARKDGSAATMHEWRKRVKDLRYAAEMLEGREQRRRIHRVAKRADELGELLGEEHDLALLADRVRASEAFAGRPKARRALQKLIARRRKALRKQALELGERLYRRKPKCFTRRIRREYARAARA